MAMSNSPDNRASQARMVNDRLDEAGINGVETAAARAPRATSFHEAYALVVQEDEKRARLQKQRL